MNNKEKYIAPAILQHRTICGKSILEPVQSSIEVTPGGQEGGLDDDELGVSSRSEGFGESSFGEQIW